MPDSPDYQLIRKLGAGAFGEVWHAHGPGGVAVALKFIRLDAHVFTAEFRSLEVMKSIRHPNRVSLFGAWHRDNRRTGLHGAWVNVLDRLVIGAQSGPTPRSKSARKMDPP